MLIILVDSYLGRTHELMFRYPSRARDIRWAGFVDFQGERVVNILMQESTLAEPDYQMY